MDARGGTAPVAVGDHIDGKYVVEAILGMGGMGMVVRAMHVDLHEQVALKFLLAEALQRTDAVDRFLREARAVRKLRSEHVVRVLDVGRLSGSGLPYIAMELLEGEDLERRLRDRGPLPIDEACMWIVQACEALAEAHAQGIVHRDLKPGNLFVARHQGAFALKVLDFGIAKTIGTQGSGTRTAAVVGSVLYMSPEQMRSAKKVDPRSDVWSLGVTLFELLGGRPPFDGDDVPGLILAVTSDAPRRLSELRTDVPPALEAIVMRCLEKSPDARMPSMGELATALAPFAGAHAHAIAARAVQMGPAVASLRSSTDVGSSTGVSSKDSAGLAAVAVSVPRGTNASWGGTGSLPTGSRTSKLLLVAGVLVALVGVTGAAAMLLRSRSAPSVEMAKGVASEPPAAPSAATAPSMAPMRVDEIPSPTAMGSSEAPAAVAPVAATAAPRPRVVTGHTGSPGRPVPAASPKGAPHGKPSGIGSGID
jgi:serine/threonine-protein kinase